jgi:ABC-type glycerol-3-phosphate transport system substrate-binding protein
MRRLAALAVVLAVLTGCGSSSSGGKTEPVRVYKPNSNQNPDNDAH